MKIACGNPNCEDGEIVNDSDTPNLDGYQTVKCNKCGAIGHLVNDEAQAPSL